MAEAGRQWQPGSQALSHQLRRSSLAPEPGTLSAETAGWRPLLSRHASCINASCTMRHSMLPGGPCLYSLIIFFNPKPCHRNREYCHCQWKGPYDSIKAKDES
jgi:hypothetical protein